jgi:outer membrane protein TolC
MKEFACRPALWVALCMCWLVPQGLIYSQTNKEDLPAAFMENPGGSGIFSKIFGRFQARSVAPLTLENSPRLENLIRDGKLELTLSEAIALALENNLDVAVQRFIPTFAQTDLVRSKAGQSPRGFTGSSTPGGLTAGAIGAGITGSGSGSGVGSAGGISGGGGSVSVGSSGNFDPSVSFNFSWDRTVSPLNTIQVSGVPTVTGKTTAFSASFAQLFAYGTSYTLSLTGQAQQSTQKNLIFNPASVTRFSVGANQPLLNGFGRLANERYIWVARNNTRVSQNVFRAQVIATVVAVENAYWDLAAQQLQIRVAEEALAVAQQLYKDNQYRQEVGTMSALDVTSAESEVAARTRDLTIASTNLQFQEANLKSILAKKVSPTLDAATVVIEDQMPEPKESDIPDLETALATALESRTELLTAEVNQQNQQISVDFTEDSLRPSLAVFGLYAGSGLRGTSSADPTSTTGLSNAFGQSFTAEYPEYAGGFNIGIPLRNRSAQADNLRAQLEANQMRITSQRSRNTASLEVRKAIIGLIQGKAQVEAARKAASLARQMWEGEQKKLEAGASTSYQVILRERDYTTAQQAEVSATVAYAKAIVEMDRARGITVERNGIEYTDALSGNVSKMPVTPFSLQLQNKEAR